MLWPSDPLRLDSPTHGNAFSAAIHEAGHAIMVRDTGYEIDHIRVHTPPGTTGVTGHTQILTEEVDAESGALIRAASRPAMTFYWHLLGIYRYNRELIESSVNSDESELQAMCKHDPGVVRSIQWVASRWIMTQWPRVWGLAREIQAADGHLQHPDIPRVSLDWPGANLSGVVYENHHHRCRAEHLPRRRTHQ